MSNCNGFVRRESDKNCWFKDNSPTSATYDTTLNYYYKETAPVLPVPIKYKIHPNTDYPTSGIDYISGTQAECQKRCNSMSNCNGFVRRESDKGCWFKDSSHTSATYDSTLNYYYKETAPVLPKHYRSGSWTKINPVSGSQFKQVSVDKNIVCGITNDNAIYCKDDLESSNWFNVPGGKKQISINNGKLHGTNNLNQVYYLDNYKGNNWKHISNIQLKQVDFDGNIVCGVKDNDEIYCKDSLEPSAPWTNVAGRLTHITVNGNKIYGVNKDGEMFYMNDYKTNKWVGMPDNYKYKQIDANSNTVCAITFDPKNPDSADNDFIRCGNTSDNSIKWDTLDGKLKQISVSNGVLYGTSKQNEVYTRL